MVKQEARFHMVMLLSRVSNPAANRFEAAFEHEERDRSSHKAEMREINTFWQNELQGISALSAKKARELPTDRGIDEWLEAFRRDLLDTIVSKWV